MLISHLSSELPNLLVGLVEDEERDRQVIGLGAADKRLVLAKMVDGAMTEMALSEDKAIEALLSKGSYMRDGTLVFPFTCHDIIDMDLSLIACHNMVDQVAMFPCCHATSCCDDSMLT